MTAGTREHDSEDHATARSGRCWSLGSLRRSNAAALREAILARTRGGARLAGMWAWRDGDGLALVALLAVDASGRVVPLRGWLEAGEPFPSLTPDLPAAHVFEREIGESFGARFAGHPWPKPVIDHAELRGEPPAFFRVDGPGVHEVAVGPVHAGIIEPGHFRFQCAGETVLHLEIQLGYQHRSAEAMLEQTQHPARRLAIAESIAGDTAIGHALAHCELLETLTGAHLPPRAQALRTVALELERIANHVGDLGALCNDVAYLPGAAYFGRLRGEFLNLLLELSGNRFGRGLIIPGGVRFDLDAALAGEASDRLAAALRDLDAVAELAFSNPSLLSRFERTGPLDLESVERLGLVGPIARASGSSRDVRADHPSGYFRFAHVPVARLTDGDVLGRAMIRLVEAKRSIAFVSETIDQLPSGGLAVPMPASFAGTPDAIAVSLVEGWRGEIVHLAATGSDGRIGVYRICDPSLHNWFGLAIAMRGQQISDFPLCNKSFNLSYAGHDR